MTTFCKIALAALILGAPLSAQVPVPLPKAKPKVPVPFPASAKPATVVSPAVQVSNLAPDDARFTHDEIIAELLFEIQFAKAKGEGTKALERLVAKHRKALAGATDQEPILGGAWVDPGTGASFSIYQNGADVVIITETLGDLDELWQRLDAAHNGEDLSVVLDDALFKVDILDAGNRLQWGKDDYWQRIPALTGAWADPAKDLVFSIVQEGTDVLLSMVSEEGKKYWTKILGTQRGDRLILEYKQGFVSTIITPDGQLIVWPDAANTRWVKLPALSDDQ